MKWTKWVWVLAIGTALILGAVGCGSSDSGGGGGVEGSWKATSFNGLPLPSGVALSITLSDNGTYSAATTYEGVTATETGTWSTSGNQLTTVHEGEAESVTYSISGNTMILSDPEGVFTLTRQ